MNIDDKSIMLPNYTLKKLIQDLINEGGKGLYTADDTDDRLIDVRPEKILVLKCLGPPESDWNQLSFNVIIIILIINYLIKLNL